MDHDRHWTDAAARREGLARRGRRLGLSGTVALHAVGLGALLVLDASLPTPEASASPLSVLLLPPAPPDAPLAIELPRARLPIHRPSSPVAFAGPEPVAPPAPDKPAWIPHEVAPVLLNPDAVVAMLDGAYPAELPSGARSSRVVLWLFVDRAGHVTAARLRDSSGYAALDRLAQVVAGEMVFRPALDAGQPVGVWVEQPIRFAARP